MNKKDIIDNKHIVEILKYSDKKGKNGIFLPCRVILWKRDSIYHKYITHLAVLQESGKYSLAFGHYFESYEQAKNDFYKRCKTEGVDY